MMTDETHRAAAALLYKTAVATLRRCRGNNPDKSGEALAFCATPQLADLVRNNDTLMDALARHFALQVASDLPPLPAKPKAAPRDENWSINLFEPEPEK